MPFYPCSGTFYRSEYCCPASPELDFRSKKGVVNKGERRRYLVENSHEPIIDKATFQKVQEEIRQRREELRRFMRAIEGCENADEFIPGIWNSTVERGVVMAGGEVVWEMMDGERIRVKR